MKYLDKSLPVGALATLESELLWERCCREAPQDPWSAFAKACDANQPPLSALAGNGQRKGIVKGIVGDIGAASDA